MVKRIFICGLIMMPLLVLSCSAEQPESDFEFEIKGEENEKAVTITKYVGTPKDVRIPQKIQGAPVTEIGIQAFTQVTQMDTDKKRYTGLGLTSVTIPNGVEIIGEGAFAANKLTSVTIPDSVRFISQYAFGWNQLSSVTVPNSVESIGEGAFVMNQLTQLTIPDSVKMIEFVAFAANKLTSLTLPDSVTAIGESAFWENQLSSLTLPNSVTSIGVYAFKDNKITSVTIGSDVTLEEGSFVTAFINAYNRGGKKAGTYTVPEKESGISGGTYAYFSSKYTQLAMGYFMLNTGDYVAFLKVLDKSDERELKNLEDEIKCPALMFMLLGLGEEAIVNAIPNTSLGMISWSKLYDIVSAAYIKKDYATMKMLIKAFDGDENGFSRIFD
jgi:hypothetical protein